MWKIFVYSSLLIAGLFTAQCFNLENIATPLHFITLICLAYIMIEVGLEFTIDKRRLSSYTNDFWVAATAATFPWIICFLYFYFAMNANFSDSLIVARFAAPTSAGVLFTMLTAAGLAATWLFKKARILAIFDDLYTILLMIPLQFAFVGLSIDVLYLLLLIFGILFIAYRFIHQLKLPLGEGWILLYGAIIVLLCTLLEHHTDIELEVLLPAFGFGCLLYHPEEKIPIDFIDTTVKMVFMFLVGCSMPKINFSELALSTTAIHVTLLTILSNLGKMYPAFCYQKEASLRERLALSVAMFPRGEVGAGVLLVAINTHLQPEIITVGALSLILNLLLTGVFIAIAIWLINKR